MMTIYHFLFFQLLHNNTIMRKLITNLMLAAFLKSLVSATPANHFRVKLATINKIETGEGHRLENSKNTFQLHPLDILALKFN